MQTAVVRDKWGGLNSGAREITISMPMLFSSTSPSSVPLVRGRMEIWKEEAVDVVTSSNGANVNRVVCLRVNGNTGLWWQLPETSPTFNNSRAHLLTSSTFLHLHCSGISLSHSRHIPIYTYLPLYITIHGCHLFIIPILSPSWSTINLLLTPTN